jgi:hypothetical protein
VIPLRTSVGPHEVKSVTERNQLMEEAFSGR